MNGYATPVKINNGRANRVVPYNGVIHIDITVIGLDAPAIAICGIFRDHAVVHLRPVVQANASATIRRIVIHNTIVQGSAHAAIYASSIALLRRILCDPAAVHNTTIIQIEAPGRSIFHDQATV